MRKRMRPVEVSSGEDGSVLLRQAHDHFDDAEPIDLTPEQLPTVLRWLREAAGLPEEGEGGSARGDEIRAMARRFRQLEQAAGSNPEASDGVLTAIRVALEWASGESALSPQEWLFQRPEGRPKPPRATSGCAPDTSE